mmetsp:Transcript_14272/g.34006  ORF Transcript_14272/g.34006 Transcript_14272/m.34006 type:complete len:256 (+) Transcript_14272:271-1038(+)
MSSSMCSPFCAALTSHWAPSCMSLGMPSPLMSMPARLVMAPTWPASPATRKYLAASNLLSGTPSPWRYRTAMLKFASASPALAASWNHCRARVLSLGTPKAPSENRHPRVFWASMQPSSAASLTMRTPRCMSSIVALPPLIVLMPCTKVSKGDARATSREPRLRGTSPVPEGRTRMEAEPSLLPAAQASGRAAPWQAQSAAAANSGSTAAALQPRGARRRSPASRLGNDSKRSLIMPPAPLAMRCDGVAQGWGLA